MTTALLGIADDRALGGSMRVIVTHPQTLAAAKAAVDGVVLAIDLAASRFREDSELSRLNAMPDKVVKVSPLLAQAIAVGLRGAEISDGAVDPTIGHALELTGYDADFSSMASQGAALRLVAKRIPGWRAIHFNASARTVLVPRGVVIDLGSTGKALAADLAAAAAARVTGDGGVLVSLGGDIAVAGEPPPGGWQIQVSEDSAAPIEGGEETVSITDGGIATSGTTARRWMRGEIVLHHIIDPSTGLPVDSPWRTATVAAASCVDANIASTAAIVMGDDAIAWLKIQGLAARVVGRDGRIRRVNGWPDPADSKRAPNLF
ncbi:MAG TPA: FAD:protein FMN transferase [Candidatus Dormibacteraeota bacterium]|nr:FAD:protein FMN transferase [Candidatus Dormibacteraeota bacterium]